MYPIYLKACLVCLSADRKLYKCDSGQLRNEYCFVSGFKEDDLHGIPEYLCVECAAYVKRFKNFREKCKRAHFTWKQILQSKKQVTVEMLEAINREQLNIAPSLSYLNTDNVNYETVTFKWERHNRLGLSADEEIPVFLCSTLDEANEFEVPKKKPKLSNSIKEEIDETEKAETNNDDTLLAEINNGFLDIDDEAFQIHDNGENLEVEQEKKVDGTKLDEEYATLLPISMKEAGAVVEVYKFYSVGKFVCTDCNRKFFSEKRLTAHLRMHSQILNGNHQCVLCNMFYKTEFLLKTHMNEKHLYKYLCKKCPEVSFDRKSAKQHFIWSHLQKGEKKGSNWYDNRPTWLANKGGPRRKGVVTIRPVRKITKLPEDFPLYSPVSQEEQYKLMEDRKKTRNYIEALYKCEMCYKGFRELVTYAKHMKKHDPAFAGPLQCDMCKLHFRDARRIYKHMIITHIFKYSCQLCSFVSPNRGQAHMHYRWHKNVTYPCPHCDKEFKKASTRLTHIRIKHPSTNVCNVCGHSFVGENGLYCHKRIAHTAEEVEAANSMSVDESDPQYCEACGVQFVSAAAFTTHLGSSSKHAATNLSIKSHRVSAGPRRAPGPRKARRPTRPRYASADIINTGVPTATTCELCGCDLPNDVAARRHYEAEHPGAELLKRYMCDQCGHTTRQYANLVVHMRTHTQEKPYTCPHCDRRFSMPGNRDRHLVVHTGEKKYQCQHCSRRFTQSSAVKLHIQTVHLKIPYAPWDKKNRKRRKEMESMNAAAPLNLLPTVGAPGAAAGAGATAGTCLQPAGAPHGQPKLLLDTQGDYLNAYITYND